MRMMRWISPLLLASLVISLYLPLAGTNVLAQPITPGQNARVTLEGLTPEERVGQLFLVTFQGTDFSAESQIYDLIVNHHVGGVVLQAGNDNFVEAPDTVRSAFDLIYNLQKIEWDSSFQPVTNDPVTGNVLAHTYIPLFTGISQEGGGYPNDQILSGLTPLPNQMAIGATWNPEIASLVGSVLGSELSRIGFNLILGPSLDVLNAPKPSLGNAIGTRVFGGDPFWVGELSQAYISGLHTGSDGRMVVIAKHFPGRGDADRPPQEEVATVRKSLEQLKQIELAPFFAVTGNAVAQPETIDGLLISHIRYQGFQGNIRATTRPVSFDQQALSQIMSLQSFSTWRDRGGLVVSDDLGSQAVRRFYDPGGLTFSARLVTRDAFLAGNDLLYMGNIVSSDLQDNYSTVVRTIEFFAQKYREDPAFAQRVDDSVLRILTQKFRMYNAFSFALVQSDQLDVNEIGNQQEVTFSVARQAATLISPDPIDLDVVLPTPPESRERIIFITDERLGSQCSTCPQTPMMSINALESAVIRLYGPSGGDQVTQNNLSSYSFSNLAAVLDGGPGMISMENDLRRAEWIVLSVSDIDTDQSQVNLIRRFLTERQVLLRNKKVILFSFGAPYYLDATDISKLTAYYGLYSKEEPFINVAARLLFRELAPIGDLPVSVPGIGYDLINATAPDPNQVISLHLDLPVVTSAPVLVTPEPTPVPLFRVADTISIRTGMIVDHNQRTVPDGTVVRFTLAQTDGAILQQFETVTIQGVAQASFRLDKPGLIEIRAVSEPAVTSVVLQLDVTGGEGSAVTVVAPTQQPTSTPEITPVAPQPTNTGGRSLLSADGYPRIGAWLVMTLMLGIGAWLAYRIGREVLEPRWGVRLALCLLVGGLAGYNYLALGLPGSVEFVEQRGFMAILQVTVIGEGVGLLLGWAWSRILTAQRDQEADQKEAG